MTAAHSLYATLGFHRAPELDWTPVTPVHLWGFRRRLRPGAQSPVVTDLARDWAAGKAVTYDLSNLAYPPTVSPTLLLVAITLSVVKPWGRIRRVG
jgi:hypothetical protein